MNPYEAGQDYAINGANEENCHFSHFATPEGKREWERGRDETRKTLKLTPPNQPKQ